MSRIPIIPISPIGPIFPISPSDKSFRRPGLGVQSRPVDQANDNYHPSRPVRSPRRLVLRLRDGRQTSVFVHDPPAGTTRRLSVLYVHGIQSHPGWFAGSAAAMAAAGHPVFQVTRRGSGDSCVMAAPTLAGPGSTGTAPAGLARAGLARADDRGHASSPGQLLDDLTDAARLVARHACQARMHLVGVSWGGKLLAAYAGLGLPRKADLDIASLTLIAPGLVPRVDVPTLLKLRIALSLPLSQRRLFDIPLNDVELFTDNPAMQQYLRDDPLRLHQATARFLYVSRQIDRLIARLPDGCIDIPTRLILADRDRIIDNEATAAVVQRLTGKRAEVLTLSGAHTLEFEIDPQPLYDALTFRE